MIEYLLESTICFSILYLGFLALLSKSRNYQTTRIFLLFSISFSVLIPFFNLSSTNVFSYEVKPYEYLHKTLLTVNSMQDNSGKLSSENVIEDLNFSNIIKIIYASISILLFVRYLHNLYILVSQNIISDKIDYRGNKLILVDKKVNPYSFFRAIYVSRERYLNATLDNDLVLHETAHKNQWHSIDIVIIELIQVFFWFNPFVYLFKSSIKINHEYLADDFVIKSGTNNSEYSHKLINSSLRNKTMNLASGFNYSLIKKRLIMLSKYEQKKGYTYQLAVLIPVIVVLFLTTAFVNNTNALQASPETKISSTTSSHKPGTFYADTLFWSAENHEIYLKGKVNVKYGKNDFKGRGSFSFLGQVHLLIIDGKAFPINSALNLSGMKCQVTKLTEEEAVKKYETKGKSGVVEITTAR